jgi:hypothetical protein
LWLKNGFLPRYIFGHVNAVDRAASLGRAMPDVYAKTFRRAAEIIGSTRRLALHLDVPPQALRLWMLGKAGAPADKFLGAVDVVIAHDLAGPSNDAEMARRQAELATALSDLKKAQPIAHG